MEYMQHWESRSCEAAIRSPAPELQKSDFWTAFIFTWLQAFNSSRSTSRTRLRRTFIAMRTANFLFLMSSVIAFWGM